jgi:hypothetical protein
VDLNPIRSGIADELEDSDFTSIQRRLRAVEGRGERGAARLEPLAGAGMERPEITLPEYVELLRWTARRFTPGARNRHASALPVSSAPVRASPDWWTGCVFRIEKAFGTAVGLPAALQAFAIATGRSSLRGLSRTVRFHQAAPTP